MKIVKKLRLDKRSGSRFTLFIFLILAASLVIKAAQWHPIGNTRQLNISGMALVENTAQGTIFIVVHDNKKKKERRAGMIKVSQLNPPQYIPLEWLGTDLPVDLEAITAIAELPNNFMTLTSAGQLYHLELNQSANSVKVIKSLETPSIPSGSNFEGFTLQKIGGKQLAVWAERGENEKPGTIYWSLFDLSTYSFAATESSSIKVPFPNANVRHISDLKVDGQGRIFISSAADPGDDGPFASAVYQAGNFSFDDASRIILHQPGGLAQVFTIETRKIEAFEIMPGEQERMVFGTDDENLGSAIYIDWKTLGQ